MAKFACLPSLSVVKKKKSKVSHNFVFLGKLLIQSFSKHADGNKKGSSKGDLRVKPIEPFSPSPENGLNEHYLTVSKSYASLDTGSSLITPIVLSDDRTEPTDAAVYNGDDENGDIQSMKRDYSDFDLQTKVELASLGSNTDLSSYVLEKMETDRGFVAEAMIANGHVSDPGMELTASLDSPVLKRSCSKIETMQAKQWTNSAKRLGFNSNLQKLSGNDGVETARETHSSPLSVRTSCSADRVMLKKRFSNQILPSRSKNIWWKLFLRSHKNFHNPRASQRLVSVVSASNLKGGFSSDAHEPCQNLDDKWNNLTETEWVSFSSGSSHVDRVNVRTNSLDDCSFIPVNVEEDCDEIVIEQIADLNRLEIEESSDKTCPNTNRHVAEEMALANNIIHSLNTFSTVAHMPGIGLKVIPSISAFACLRSVNLSGNCIVNITSESLPKSLHTLDLSRNKISTIDGLRDLERLRILNLSNNRIAKISHGLSSCTLIKELYLAGNKISNVEGLHRLLKLTVLDLSFNKIVTVKGLGQLVANYNSLLALNLLGNPILANIGDDQLRKEVLNLLPHVTYLNKQSIKPHKVREVVSENN